MDATLAPTSGLAPVIRLLLATVALASEVVPLTMPPSPLLAPPGDVAVAVTSWPPLSTPTVAALPTDCVGDSTLTPMGWVAEPPVSVCPATEVEIGKAEVADAVALATGVSTGDRAEVAPPVNADVPPGAVTDAVARLLPLSAPTVARLLVAWVGDKALMAIGCCVAVLPVSVWVPSVVVSGSAEVTGEAALVTGASSDDVALVNPFGVTDTLAV